MRGEEIELQEGGRGDAKGEGEERGAERKKH